MKPALDITHPEIAAQWHPTNNVLKPSDITYGSDKKVWWKCNVADDHEWETNVWNRVGNGCPYCANQKACKSNCLETTHPELAKQWHPTKNGILKPCNVTSGSGKKVWWKCNVAEDHEWEAIIADRIKGRGCSCCSKLKIVTSNCLETTHPELAKQWHPTKNGKLKPCNVASGSGKKVWWKCDKEKDHEWRASPNTRTNTGKGCSCCSKRTIVESNCLATTHPKIAKQWHEKNSLTPFQVSSGSNKKVWWKCDVAPDHEWISTISNRLRQGCPCCSGRKVVRSNCLETTHPELVKEWSLENKFKPNQVVAGSGENILWQCSLNPLHKWYAKIYHRVKGSGCPICNSSHGEKLIEKILNEMKIDFEREKRINNCRHKRPLPFDFAILHNGKIIALIEYQGIQHFMPINFGHREKNDNRSPKISFINVQKRDKIKKEFCDYNKIPFLVINYWQDATKLVKDFVGKM